MNIEPMYLTILLIAGGIILLVLFFHYVPFFLWLSAKVSGVNISLVQLFLMRIRNVPPYIIVPGMIEAHKAGLNKNILVSYSVAVQRQVMSGGGIEEASGKSAKTTIAEGSVLYFFKVIKTSAVSLQKLVHLVSDTKAKEIVINGSAHKELHREIASSAAVKVSLSAVLPIAVNKLHNSSRQAFVELPRQSFFNARAKLLFQVFTKFAVKQFFVHWFFILSDILCILLHFVLCDYPHNVWYWRTSFARRRNKPTATTLWDKTKTYPITPVGDDALGVPHPSTVRLQSHLCYPHNVALHKFWII